MYRTFASWFVLLSLCAAPAFADKTFGPYRNRDVAEARFGGGTGAELLTLAFGLAEYLNEGVVAQEHVAEAMEQAVIELLRTTPGRTKDPVMRHLMGLTGIGKSEIMNRLLDRLEQLGFTVLRFDVQRWASPFGPNPRAELEAALRNVHGPAVVFFDELDKIPEQLTRGNGVEEVSSPLVGMLNEIATDGAFMNAAGRLIPVHDILFLTAMNLSNHEYQEFASTVLRTSKPYYDFTPEDFALFHKWTQENPSAAVSKFLSRLFRQNTVGRRASHAMIARPPGPDDYPKIVEKKLQLAIIDMTSGPREGLSLSVDYDPSYVGFLAKHAVYAPSGSRDTVFKVRSLTAQLVDFGLRALGPDGNTRSLTQPRLVHIAAGADEGSALLTITPYAYGGGGVTTAQKSFQLRVRFNEGARLFATPQGLAKEAPELPARATTSDRLTRRQIADARFGASDRGITGFVEFLEGKLFGLDAPAALLQERVNAFLARRRPGKHADYLVFASLPGQGKTDLTEQFSLHSKLPRVRINLQGYGSDKPEVLDHFLSDLQMQIADAQRKSEERGLKGKFLLVIEDPDKVFEKNPLDGKLHDRPVMVLLKDLLNDRVIHKMVDLPQARFLFHLDAKDCFIIVNMNFASDPFGFSADPRITSVGDVQEALDDFAERPADQKAMLDRIFLPETVSRFFDRFVVLPAAGEETYRKTIEKAATTVTMERFLDPKTGRNDAMLELQLDQSYLDYLYGEAVVGALGPRSTLSTASRSIERDLDDMLLKLPRSGRWGSSAIKLRLSYDSATTTITGTAIPARNSGLKAKVLYKKFIVLRFPPTRMDGPMPERRLHVALHEHGHAFGSMRFGTRFESAMAVQLQGRAGGMVKVTEGEEDMSTGKSAFADLLVLLSARAMERALLATRPRSTESPFATTPGAASDIVQVTKKLWNLVYQWGFDLRGGSIDRWGIENGLPYAKFADLPDDAVRALAAIIGDMEDWLVADILRAHPHEWHRARIVHLAREGYVTEEAYYAEAGYRWPGPSDMRVAGFAPVAALFGDDVEAVPGTVRRARAFRQGATKTTAEQNLDAALKVFLESVAKRLHGEDYPKDGTTGGRASGYDRTTCGPKILGDEAG